MRGGTLRTLAENARRALADGVYGIEGAAPDAMYDMAGSIRAARQGACIISEVKFASPSRGTISGRQDHARIAQQMVSGGAAALSVLTQPHLFGGSPKYFEEIRRLVQVPMLMKDVILDRAQLDAARRIGADCVLLIQAIFDAGYASDIDGFIEWAHARRMQVLLEVHDRAELASALRTRCDVIGVNNRNLDTLQVSLETTRTVLAGYQDVRPAVSESGIETPQDVAYLRRCGASAFLVGTSIMKGDDITGGVGRLVRAL